MFSGKKTYVVALVMALFNAIGWYLNSIGQGGIDPQTAMQGIFAALGLAGLRAGVAKTNGTSK